MLRQNHLMENLQHCNLSILIHQFSGYRDKWSTTAWDNTLLQTKREISSYWKLNWLQKFTGSWSIRTKILKQIEFLQPFHLLDQRLHIRPLQNNFFSETCKIIVWSHSHIRSWIPQCQALQLVTSKRASRNLNSFLASNHHPLLSFPFIL